MVRPCIWLGQVMCPSLTHSLTGCGMKCSNFILSRPCMLMFFTPTTPRHQEPCHIDIAAFPCAHRRHETTHILQ